MGPAAWTLRTGRHCSSAFVERPASETRRRTSARRVHFTKPVAEIGSESPDVGRKRTPATDMTVPEREDLVFAHGDFSLPNIILRETQRGEVQVAGFIDCGRSGVADRHQDVALAIRSIVRNFGSEWVTPFLHAYGLPHPDPDTVAFFTLLDEFF